MGNESRALEEVKPKKDDTISLTKMLVGMDGKHVKLMEEDENGKRTSRNMDVRLAIMLALRQGSRIAEQNKALSESDKIRCFELGVKVSNEESSGCTFKLEDRVLIKRLANLWLSAEPYGAFLMIFDPTSFDK